MDQGQRIIVILSAILAAVLVTTGILLWILPGPHTPATTTPAATPNSSLDSSLFQKSEYTQLDQRPVLDNSVPVQPPATTGKANPFL